LIIQYGIIIKKQRSLEKMKTDEYKQIEDYMHSCMGNSSHDREHVMRVLFTALRLARAERGIDF